MIAHNIRSSHNIGSIFRTCDGLGIEKLYLTGYSPYPAAGGDNRLPHVVRRVNARITKTALGAEKSVNWEHTDTEACLKKLKAAGYRIVGLEQDKSSRPLHKYAPADKVALLLGEEINGLDAKLLEKCDELIEIPMLGEKESFNVSVATAIALYHLRFIDT